MVINQIKKIFFRCCLPAFGLILLFMPLKPIFAAETIWVTAKGTASLSGRTQEKARLLALERAAQQAVDKFADENISTRDLLVTLRLSNNILGAIPFAKIVRTEILTQGREKMFPVGQSIPSIVYQVKIKAEIEVWLEESDPDFHLNMVLNQKNFIDGSKMQISMTSSKDCFVLVFIIMEDEKVLKLIPNRYRKDNFLKANNKFIFPDENDIGRGIILRVFTPQDKDRVTESVYAIALKRPVKLGKDKIQEGIFGIFDGKTAFMDDLIKEIVRVPQSDRAEKLIQYQIEKK